MDQLPSPDHQQPWHNLPPRSSFRLRDRIVDYQLAEMAVLLRTGELSAEQLTIACLARLYEFEDANGLSMPIDAQQALTRARLADQWLSNTDDPRGPPPLLCGIVLGMGESLATVCRKGQPWTLEDSPVVARLREQGAVLLGPLLSDNHPIGLSGFSAGVRLCAAALAQPADEAFMIPAPLHGASAIKPSLGLAMGWRVPGSVARSVRDAALVLAAIDTADSREGAAAPLKWPVTARQGDRPLSGLRIGMQPTHAPFDDLKAQLSRLGAHLLECPAPPQADWEKTLLSHRLDCLLMPGHDSPGCGWQPHVPGWPMVTFPIRQANQRRAGVNALLCGPHLSDALLVQIALDFQARHTQYHETAPQLRVSAASPSSVTAPRKAWPTG